MAAKHSDEHPASAPCQHAQMAYGLGILMDTEGVRMAGRQQHDLPRLPAYSDYSDRIPRTSQLPSNITLFI